MKIGYVRVSRDTQVTDLQKDVMEKEQVERVFTDTMSGKRFDRPYFLEMLDMLRPGDVLVVWRLDRLGRSLLHLIETVTMLQEKGIELRSLRENIDTTTPTGKLMFHIMAALAEFERDVIRERTMAGLEAARARGHKGGAGELSIRCHVRRLLAPRSCTMRRRTQLPRLCVKQVSKVERRSTGTLLTANREYQ